MRRLMLLTALALTFATLFARHLRINLTASLPRGLYWFSPGARPLPGRLAVFCPPEPAEAVGLARGYLLRGKACPAGSLPLQKVAIAGAGHRLELTTTGLFLDDRLLSAPPPTRDSQGRDIVPLYGSYLLAVGEWWMSTSSPNSWDSRYYGPVHERSVLGRSRPLLTWE